MIATSSAAIAAAERLKAQAGARVHRLCEPDELQEDSMPRKSSTEPKPEAPAIPKKRGRPAKAKAEGAKPRKSAAPRFGVFDDGSVMIELPHCAGQMNPAEVQQFTGFLKRIGVEL